MAAVVGDSRIFRMETNERIVCIGFGRLTTKSLTEVPDITWFTEIPGANSTQTIHLKPLLEAMLAGDFYGRVGREIGTIRIFDPTKTPELEG
ncbi:hypothetical protein [Bremerella cremea]|uniref:hypothetical protein n=1 Tax=Bremerella cremea TaxID=1031537 RepID=UPI0031E75817